PRRGSSWYSHERSEMRDGLAARKRTRMWLRSSGLPVDPLTPATRRPHMLPTSALKSMRVMFATPCYISAVSMNYVASMFSLALDSTHVGLPCILHMHSESLITRGRNKIVLKFLSEDFTHLFWIDSDIAFTPQAVFRLLLADRDVATGIYPMKHFK